MTPVAAHRHRLGRLVAVAALFGLAVGPLGALVAPASRVGATPGLPVEVDATAVTVVDGLVAVAPGPTLVLPLVNTSAAAVALGSPSYDEAIPDELAPGATLAMALTSIGVDPATVVLAGNLAATDNCAATVLAPSPAAGSRCQVRLRNGDPGRPAGAWVRWYDGVGTMVFETFALWRTGTAQLHGDRLTDAVRFAGVAGLWPDPVTPGVPGSLPDVIGTTIGMTAEGGEPAHAGTAAARSWWHEVHVPVPGRLDVHVDAVGPTLLPSTAPVRASLYRIPSASVEVPTIGGLQPLAAPASAIGPQGALDVTSPVDDASVYFLAVDDLGTATDVRVSFTFTPTPPTPTNDTFAGATDLSALPVPAYVAGANGRPVDTAPVTGTTVGSTREAFEYGTTVNPDGSESPPPNGTVWYRYTAPANGFSGRLGLQVTPGFFVAPLTPASGLAGSPTGRHDEVQYAPGNTWPPSGIQFVRMEPGHTVWFQVQAALVSDQPPVWNDGGFTLELFQAPNEQDDIGNAYDVNSGNPWSSPFNWYGDGDTYHTTPDQPNGPATMWFTATFAQTGTWGFTVSSEGAARQPSTRPLGLRLYRAPSSATVSDPSTLALVTGTAGALDPDGPFGTGAAQWVAQLADVPVQPGRYYWSVDRGAAGPTFFELRSSFTAGVVVDTTPPDTVIDSSAVVGRDLTVAFSGSDDRPGAVRFECALAPESGFDLASVAWGPCTSPQVHTNLANGRYVFAARAVDAAGNIDPSPALRTVVITPAVPTLSIADKSIVEGNRGVRYLRFQVTLSSPSTQVVVARYATQSGTARRYSDYWPASGTVVLQPGQLMATVQVAVLGDRVVEPHEWFTMRLSSVSGAALGRALAVGTILNDDGRRVAGRVAPM